MGSSAAVYVGQVEQDPQGNLWAVLYCRDQVITREQVRSLRKAKRRVTDLVLSAADNYPAGGIPVAPEPTPYPQVTLRAPAAPAQKSAPRAAVAHLV